MISANLQSALHLHSCLITEGGGCNFYMTCQLVDTLCCIYERLTEQINNSKLFLNTTIQSLHTVLFLPAVSFAHTPIIDVVIALQKACRTDILQDKIMLLNLATDAIVNITLHLRQQQQQFKKAYHKHWLYAALTQNSKMKLKSMDLYHYTYPFLQ